MGGIPPIYYLNIKNTITLGDEAQQLWVAAWEAAHEMTHWGTSGIRWGQ